MNPHGLYHIMTLASIREWNPQVGRNVFRAQRLLKASHPTVYSLLEMEAIQLKKVTSVPVTDMACAGRTPDQACVVKIYWDDEGVDGKEVFRTAREMVAIIESGDNLGESAFTNRGKSPFSSVNGGHGLRMIRRRASESDGA